MSKDKRHQDHSAVAGFYDSLAPIYTRLRDYGHKRDGRAKTLLIDALGPFADDIVLDVGTGPGIYALDIAKQSANSRVVGIDISETFINIAKTRASEAGIDNIVFSLGNIEQLEFSDRFFTKIVCAGVLSVVHQRERAVLELSRVLRPGGRLTVREPKRSESLVSRLACRLPKESRIRRAACHCGWMFGHFSPNFMTALEMRALFHGCGFSQVTLEPYGSDVLITATK